jgi:polysaccharide biosynthesis protein PslG
MRNAGKLRSFGFVFAIMWLSLTAAAQCPMGMEVHNVPAKFPTLAGKGICHLRLWDSQTNWIDLETSDGVYDWSNLDGLLNEAQNLGVDVLYTFGKVPGWASSDPTDPHCTDNYHAGDCAPPSDVNSGDNYFKAYVTALMAHVGTKISYFEMWNEPYNLPYWDGTPQELAIMVSDAAAIIRAANPNALVMTPSVSPWKNQHVFVQAFLEAIQGQVTFDVFSMHDYTWGGPAEKIVSEIENVESFQSAMGMDNIPLWGVEGSDKEWTTSPILSTQQEKNDFIARYYTLELNHGSLRHYWYSWNGEPGMLMATQGAQVYKIVSSWFTNRTPQGCVVTPYDGGDEYVCTLQDTTAHQIVWVTNGTGTFATTASEYETELGGIVKVVNGSVPISSSPIFIVK